MPGWTQRVLFFMALLGLWFMVTWSGGRLENAVPSPVDVGYKVVEGVVSGEYPLAVAASMRRMALGFGVAALAGMALGLVSSRVAWVGDTLGSFMVGMLSLPSICWLPLAMLWFGWNEKAVVFVTVTGALFAVATGVEAGIRAIPPLYLQAAANMGARGTSLYTRVLLPAALPSVVGGLRLGWAFAWRSLMAGELLATSKGLGYLLSEGRQVGDAPRMIAAVLLILASGLLADALIFRSLEYRIRRRWGLIHVRSAPDAC